MKIRIVCYEDVTTWIGGKFALKMNSCLLNMGHQSDIAKQPDSIADVNHHIFYGGYDGKKCPVDTLMITHIDNIDKLKLVKQQLNVAAAGICMSRETMDYLHKMGVDKDKLHFVNPAHDGMMPIRKIIIGLSCRVQADGRKREYFLDKLAKALDSRYFKFKIMGDSWEPQVNHLRRNGFEVDYYDRFEQSEYVKFIPSLDYYLYIGMDEGQMGFIDAVAAGVKTIVTAQGYHLDAPNAIVHPFTTYSELEGILLSLQKEKKQLIDSVASWNWVDYTKKHTEIWSSLINGAKDNNFLNKDFTSKIDSPNVDENFVRSKMRELRKEKYSHLYYSVKRKAREIRNSQGVGGFVSAVVNKFFKKDYKI